MNFRQQNVRRSFGARPYPGVWCSVFALFAVLLSGCTALPAVAPAPDTGATSTDASTTDASTTNTGASSPATDADAAPVVEDAFGEPVTITDASRIIALGGPVTEIVFALGAGDQVVARDSSSSYPPEVNDLPDVGYQRRLSAEGVLALDPTLILATTEAGPPEAIQQLQDSGVTFLMVEAVDSPEGAFAKIRSFAQALDRVEEGEALIAQIRADLAEAQEIAASYEETPRVMFIYARGAGAVNVAGTDTGAEAMIELAGGESAVTDYEGYKPITAEAAVAAAPDVILLMDSGLESLGGNGGLMEVPGIAQTPAGEAGKIVAMDGLFLLNFGPRMGEAAKELAVQIHETE
jgi:iron complex transport system substrate-binding protein